VSAKVGAVNLSNKAEADMKPSPELPGGYPPKSSLKGMAEGPGWAHNGLRDEGINARAVESTTL